jgi:hypothetical protein
MSARVPTITGGSYEPDPKKPPGKMQKRVGLRRFEAMR